MNTCLKKVKLDFTELNFHENYVISQIFEDAVIGKEEILVLIDKCTRFYQTRPFVYISRRVSSYNVDPTIYLRLLKVKNLFGIAIVSERASSLKMAAFEKNFAKVPFEIFIQITEAVNWAENQVKNKKADL